MGNPLKNDPLLLLLPTQRLRKNLSLRSDCTLILLQDPTSKLLAPTLSISFKR